MTFVLIIIILWKYWLNVTQKGSEKSMKFCIVKGTDT